jgi:hypothetical protein
MNKRLMRSEYPNTGTNGTYLSGSSNRSVRSDLNWQEKG